jgi:hypothetical protein
MSAKKHAGRDQREATNFMLFGGGAASIAFNVWAAHSIYNGWAAWILAIGMLCVEVAAWLSLKHIVEDWGNGHRVKPSFGFALFGLMVIACFFMGWRAFDLKNIEISQTNENRERDALAHVERADIHELAVVAAIKAGDRTAEQTEEARRRLEQEKADALRLEVKKNPEVPAFFVFVILCVFEGLKMFGRWSIGTPTRKTPAQIAADKAVEEGKPKRTYSPRRSPEEIKAEKDAKEARRLARTGGHIAAAN